MRASLHIFVLIAASIVGFARTTFAQNNPPRPEGRTEARFEGLDEGLAALNRGNNTRAATILGDVVRREPSSDAYLYLGVAYGRLRESVRAEETLIEGARRYPEDARFHNELAEIYLGRRDEEKARAALKAALKIDPANRYAADLIANVSMLDDDVRSALDAWNRNGQPIVADVLHNRYPNFGHWTIGKALAFKSGDTLHYSQWRTTDRRLFETRLYTNVGVDIEPATRDDYYSVNLRTSARTNSKSTVVFDLLKGAPFRSTYLDVWNLRNSGVSVNSAYRWETHRQRATLRLSAPLPLPGLPLLDVSGVWQSERWDISSRTVSPSVSDLFDYRATGGRLMVRYIPDYRVETGFGWEYRNRDARNGPPALLADRSGQTAKLLGEIAVRVADRQSFRSRIRAEGFMARRSFGSDFAYSGGVVEAASRWRSRQTPRAGMSWTLAAGTLRGQAPVEEYFVLGVEAHPRFLLRGHPITANGTPGASPMGSAFLLANYAIEGVIAKVPTFQAVNLPHLEVKAEFFMDAARTFDRARIFKQDGTFLDVGVGLQFATPTHALHLIYGQSTTDGRYALTAYLERIW